MTPSVYQHISKQLVSQGSQPRKPSPDKHKAQALRRYYFRKELLAQQDRRCVDCYNRKKLRLIRINRNGDKPSVSDYLLLCQACRTERQENERKTRVWSRGPGKRGGCPESSKLNFLSSIRSLVFERDGHQCVWCGGTEKLGLAPLIPESQRGKVCYDNYVVSCDRCRPAKGRLLPLEFIWKKEFLPYCTTEGLNDGVTVNEPRATTRLTVYFVGELCQFLSRLIADESLDIELRSKAERLRIKLNGDEKHRGKERKAEQASMNAWLQ